MKRFSLFVFVCALGWLGFVSGTICTLWKFLNSTTQQCQDCPKCFAPGVTQEGCKDGNGQCYCKEGHKELTCKSCKTGWHGNKYVCCSNDHYHMDRWQCRSCGCNNDGTVTSGRKCNDDGNCNCAVGYQGTKCHQCREQYYKVNNECKECGCSKTGAVDMRCTNGTGQCNCRAGYEELKCTDCIVGISFLLDGRCKSVENLDMEFDPNGNYKCKPGYHGKECCENQYRLLPDGRCPLVMLRTFGRWGVKVFKMSCYGKCNLIFSYAKILSYKTNSWKKIPTFSLDMGPNYPRGHGYICGRSTCYCTTKNLNVPKSMIQHCHRNVKIDKDSMYIRALNVRGTTEATLVIGVTNIESINEFKYGRFHALRTTKYG